VLPAPCHLSTYTRAAQVHYNLSSLTNKHSPSAMPTPCVQCTSNVRTGRRCSRKTCRQDATACWQHMRTRDPASAVSVSRRRRTVAKAKVHKPQSAPHGKKSPVPNKTPKGTGTSTGSTNQAQHSRAARTQPAVLLKTPVLSPPGNPGAAPKVRVQPEVHAPSAAPKVHAPSAAVGTTRGSFEELSARIARDNSDPVLYRDLCIISRSYPLLSIARNLLRRKQGGAETTETQRQHCRTTGDRGLSACDADPECTVNRFKRSCVPRHEFADVERGDTFQSCEEDVEFVERWRTLSLYSSAGQKTDAARALEQDGVFDWRRKGDYGYEAHGVYSGTNGALLRTGKSDRYYMFIGYGDKLQPKRLAVLRPSVEAFAAECIERAGGKPLVMYGHSMGGQIICDYVYYNLETLRKHKNVVVMVSGARPFHEDHDAKVDRIVEALSMDRFFNLAGRRKEEYDSRVRLHPSVRLTEIVEGEKDESLGWHFRPYREGDLLKPEPFRHFLRALLPRDVKPRPALTGGKRQSARRARQSARNARSLPKRHRHRA
jgi:hypothetical protein